MADVRSLAIPDLNVVACAEARYAVGPGVMKLHGSIANNLASASQSARRLRGHPVHEDTLAHWRALLEHARSQLSKGSPEPLEPLILELANALADRSA